MVEYEIWEWMSRMERKMDLLLQAAYPQAAEEEQQEQQQQNAQKQEPQKK